MTQREEPAQPWERKPGFMEEHLYRILFGLAVLALGTGTVVYHILEGWSWVDSFYFSSVAVTTVGFGDLTPTRDVSKLLTVFYIFSGIGIITAFINARLKRHGSAVASRAQQRTR
jgi:hypothetical protein